MIDLAGVIDQSGDALIFADREGNVRVWNVAATRLFGFTADEVLGFVAIARDVTARVEAQKAGRPSAT